MSHDNQPNTARRFNWRIDYRISDPSGAVQHEGTLQVVAATPDEARRLAWSQLCAQIPELYADWTVQLNTQAISVADSDMMN